MFSAASDSTQDKAKILAGPRPHSVRVAGRLHCPHGEELGHGAKCVHAFAIYPSLNTLAVPGLVQGTWGRKENMICPRLRLAPYHTGMAETEADHVIRPFDHLLGVEFYHFQEVGKLFWKEQEVRILASGAVRCLKKLPNSAIVA